MANFFEDVRNIPYADVFCKIACPQMCGRGRTHALSPDVITNVKFLQCKQLMSLHGFTFEFVSTELLELMSHVVLWKSIVQKQVDNFYIMSSDVGNAWTASEKETHTV